MIDSLGVNVLEDGVLTVKIVTEEGRTLEGPFKLCWWPDTEQWTWHGYSVNNLLFGDTPKEAILNLRNLFRRLRKVSDLQVEIMEVFGLCCDYDVLFDPEED